MVEDLLLGPAVVFVESVDEGGGADDHTKAGSGFGSGQSSWNFGKMGSPVAVVSIVGRVMCDLMV